MSEELVINEDEELGSDELYEHYNFSVDKGQQMLRIDKFLMGRIESVTRNKLQNAIKAGSVLVNDKEVKSNYRVKPLDQIRIVLSTPPREVVIVPQEIDINIVYEDDDIMIINKRPGMVVHPGYNNYDQTLLNALTFHLSKTHLDEPTIPNLVHRIDKDTSGILLVAKNEIAQSKLAVQFFEHSIQRKYIALIWGTPKESTGTIVGHVGRSAKDRRVMAVFPDGSYGKHAITHYKVIESFNYVSLIECTLETGRTHQIRAHMRYLGHPLFSDATYGGDQILKGTTFTKYKQFVANCFDIIPRQALHAKSLGFIHPNTQQFVFFDSNLPDDMKQVIEKWRSYAIQIKDDNL
jgi:23S rRNA pseudouridine1911/1915/1917 synthase